MATSVDAAAHDVAMDDYVHIDGTEHRVEADDPVNSWLIDNGGVLVVAPGANFRVIVAGENARIDLQGLQATTAEGTTWPRITLEGATATISGSRISSASGPAVLAGSANAMNSGGHAHVTGSHLTTLGDVAVKLENGSTLLLEDSFALAQLWDSVGITMANSSVEVHGGGVTGGTGIRIDTSANYPRQNGDASRLLLDNTRIEGKHGATGAAIEVASGSGPGSAEAYIEVRNGTSLVNTGGRLLHVTQREGDHAAVAHLSVHGSVLEGEILVDAGGVATVALAQGGRIHGTLNNVARADIQKSSTWQLMGDSHVGELIVEAGGQVTLGSGEDFNTLNVKERLVGNGGTLLFNSVLAGDEAASDRLLVRGNTEGNFAVRVNNVGGNGERTVDGIQLIQVEGASNGHFALVGRAVGGAYEYFLHKGGVAGGEGNWYLRSELPCDATPTPPGCAVELPDQCALDPALPMCAIRPPEPEPEPDPELGPDPDPGVDPVPGPDPQPMPVLRPEIGAYLGNQAAADRLFRHRAPDRDGGSEAAWVQVAQTQSRRDLLRGQMALDAEERVLRVGSDVVTWGGGGHAGVMLASGEATTRSRSRVTGYTATGKVDGHALGVYAGWRSSEDTLQGGHVTASVQRGWLDNSVQGDALQKARYTSSTSSAAVELGYRFVVREDDVMALSLLPRLQSAYTQVRTAGVVEGNGTVIAAERTGRWSAAFGLRLQAQIAMDKATLTPYLDVGRWLDQGAGKLHMNGERVTDDAGRHLSELTLGVQAGWASRWRTQAELGLGRGDGRQRYTAVQASLQRHW